MFWSVVFSFMRVLCPGNMCKASQADKICDSTDCLRTAEMYKHIMDPEIEPCVQFYGHVCGNYMDVTDRPPYLDHYSPYHLSQKVVREKILNYIQTIDTKSPKGFQNVRTFYQLCMNEDERRSIGYDTLKNELEFIGMNLVPPFHSEAEPGKDFATILGKMHRFLVGGWIFLHNISVRPFLLKMNLNVLIIGSASESAWKDRRDQVIEARREYMLSVIHHLYEYSNFELTDDMKQKIEKRVVDVTILEAILSQMRESMKNENSVIEPHMIFKKPPQVKTYINELLEGGEIQMNFDNYLLALFKEDAKPSGQSLIENVIANEEFPMIIALMPLNEFEGTYRILRHTNPSVFESYIWWSVVEFLIDEGPAQLYKYRKNFIAKLTEESKVQTPRPREETCTYYLQQYFGNFIGHVLATTSNGKKKKRQINRMFKNIKESYEESIRRSQWPDDETKKAALKKIRSMTIYAGFDDSLLKKQTIDREYGKIVIQPGNFYQILTTVYRKEKEKELFKMFTINDFHAKPEFNPADPSMAHYFIAYNSVVIPMATIEFPFYDLGLEVLNYGITGSIIAHEVGHALDRTGCEYDAKGNFKSCLTDKSTEAFIKIEQCFIDAWNEFYIGIGESAVQVNGEISLVENMADWQGFNMAMMAYKKHQENYGLEPKLRGFEDLSPEKLFSFAYASMNCVNPRLDYVVRSARTSKHAPEITRTNGILRNSKQFSDAWGCPADSYMNPPNKCQIWF